MKRILPWGLGVGNNSIRYIVVNEKKKRMFHDVGQDAAGSGLCRLAERRSLGLLVGRSIVFFLRALVIVLCGSSGAGSLFAAAGATAASEALA